MELPHAAPAWSCRMRRRSTQMERGARACPPPLSGDAWRHTGDAAW